MLFAHPVTFLGRWMEVYQMHVAYTSAETAERRKAKMDDVAKRAEYRRAHGMETTEGGLGGWTAKEDAGKLDSAAREGGKVGVVAPEVDASPVAVEQRGPAEEAEATYVDFEGKRQPVQKTKWLGIW